MTEELKARIAQINAGTAPAGYKKTKVGIVPEEWEVTRFASISQKTGSERNDSDCAYPVYSINNKTGFAPQGDQFENDGYSNTSKELYRIVRKGEFAYNPARINVGSIGLLSDVDAVIISSLYVCFKLNDKCYNPYFWQYFKSHRFNFDVNNYTEGSVREYLFYDNFARIRVAVPPLPEQQKIAEILTAQDAVIALMQKQIELLQKQKKAFLQKMFPKKGCNVPEIRFAGFTDAWEQRKLGDLIEDNVILEQSDGNHGELYPRNEEFVESGIPYISAANITSDGEYIDFNETKYLPYDRAKKFRKGVTRNGDVLLAHNATVGPCLRLSMDFEYAILSTSLTLFRIDDRKMNPDYFLQMLRSEQFQSQLTKLMKQTTRNQVPILTQRIIECCYPINAQEQKAIGTYFKNLDTLITLHQRKLEFEQKKKKALMQLLLTGKVRVKT